MLHLANLSWINLLSVYGNSPSPAKLVIVSLEPVFLYIYCDSKTFNNEGFEFEIKDSVSSQIFEISAALTWDTFTVPFLSQVELGLTINAIRLNKLLWLPCIFFFSNTSCGVGGRIILNFFAYRFCTVFDWQTFCYTIS